MFVGSQNFPGSWGRIFDGSAILINIKQMILYMLVIRGHPRKPPTLVHTNIDDSTEINYSAKYLLIF